MLRLCIIGVLIDLIISVVLGIIISIQMKAIGGLIYFGLVGFTNFLIPITGACIFYHFLQIRFNLGYTVKGMVTLFTLLLVWIEVELLAWSLLTALNDYQGKLTLNNIGYQFALKNQHLWDIFLFVAIAIPVMDYLWYRRTVTRKRISVRN